MSEPQDRDQEQGAGQPTGEGDASERVITGVAAGEVDPHGASMVAAVGDETGVKAVAALDTDYFNTVLVADFADDRAANAAYLALLEADVQGILRIDGVLTAHADDQGKINIDKLTEHSTRTGVKWGAAAGLAVGILFPPAIIGSVVGWGVAGGVLGKLRNLHHRHQVSNALDGALEPNHSGIIALIHRVDVDQVKAQVPEATKVTTADVDEATARDITEAAR
ncbi:MAG: DUF1269 domain-containing protein, partial [Candidatus Limnocylindrales bacterium]